MTKLSIRIRPSNRLTLRTDRGRQGEVGPAGYAIPIDGKTILANPLNSEASPVAISAEDARSLIGAISAPDMQSALLAMWSAVLERTEDPFESGVAWTSNGHVMISTGPALGIGSMTIGTNFVVS